MVYQTDRIIEAVRTCLDQTGSTTELFGDGELDSLNLDQVITSKLLESVERVHMMAPHHLLDIGHDFSGQGVAFEPGYWGCMLLPDDFMRLIVFQMSDWERPVYDVITPNDAAYKLQRGRIKALRGTPQRPVCALVMRPTGKSMEFYSCTSTSATVKTARYVPHPEIDSNGGIDISDKCYTAVVQMAAGLTLTTCGELDKASQLIDMAKTYLAK